MQSGPCLLRPTVSVLPFISFCSSSTGPFPSLQQCDLLLSKGFALALSSTWMSLLPGLFIAATYSSFQTQRRLHWPANTHPYLCGWHQAVSLSCFIFFMAFSHVWNNLFYLLVYLLTVSLPHWNSSSVGKELCFFYTHIPSPYTTLGPQVPDGRMNESGSVVEKPWP